MRVLHPDLSSIWPGLANPHESSYALAALTLLPSGLVGIMLAAMFSATMSSLSGVLNIHASIISRDIFPTLFPRRAGEAEKLTVAWAATFARRCRDHRDRARDGRGRPQRVRGDGDLQHGDVARLRPAGAARPRGPAHAELVRPRRLRGGACIGSIGSFVLGWGLVANVVTVVPASVAVFFLSRLFPETDPAHAARRDDLFRRLDTPVDMAVELRGSHDPTTRGLPFPEPRDRRSSGLLCVPLVFTPRPRSASTVIGYVAITLALAAGLAFVRGRPTRWRRHPGERRDEKTVAAGRPAGALRRGAGLGRRLGRSGRSPTARRWQAGRSRAPPKARNAVWDGQRGAARRGSQRDRAPSRRSSRPTAPASARSPPPCRRCVATPGARRSPSRRPLPTRRSRPAGRSSSSR